MIALGLAILSLLLVVNLRRTDICSHAASEENPAAAESHPTSKLGSARRAGAHALQTTQPPQPDRALLLTAIEGETESDRSSEAFELACESVPEAELPATLDALALDASPRAAELSQLLLRRWAESDPVAAAEWTSQLPEFRARPAALEQVAIAWANADLAAAAGWVQALPESESKQAAILALAYEAARTEPVAALCLTSTLAASPARDNLLVHALSQWAGMDFTTAAIWAMQVADPILRERLVAAAAVASAEQDGAASATLAANALRAGEEQNRAAVSIVQRWAQTSPQAAASWVSQFPDIPSREAAVENLLALWTTQDAEAAGNWLHALPEGSLRDFGITAYAQSLVHQVQDR